MLVSTIVWQCYVYCCCMTCQHFPVYQTQALTRWATKAPNIYFDSKCMRFFRTVIESPFCLYQSKSQQRGLMEYQVPKSTVKNYYPSTCSSIGASIGPYGTWQLPNFVIWIMSALGGRSVKLMKILSGEIKKTTFQDGPPSHWAKDLDIILKSYRYHQNKSNILRDTRTSYVGYFNMYHVLMCWS